MFDTRNRNRSPRQLAAALDLSESDVRNGYWSSDLSEALLDARELLLDGILNPTTSELLGYLFANAVAFDLRGELDGDPSIVADELTRLADEVRDLA